MKAIFEVIESYRIDTIAKFPKHQELTGEVFDVIKEMVSVEYELLLSDKKKLYKVKEYFRDVFERAFEDEGHKSYMKQILSVFINKDISAYFVSVLKSESQGYLKALGRLAAELNYWQGCEGHMDRKLRKILDCI
ncbi:MAG: hypothetical protein IJ298_03280 [Ruminococcus sp.]|nr:hypothetical protein [Ruminococcus sp.]